MNKKSHIVFFILAIVFATLAFREVVVLGIEYGRWPRLLTLMFASIATGAFIAAGVRAWRAKNRAEPKP